MIRVLLLLAVLVKMAEAQLPIRNAGGGGGSSLSGLTNNILTKAIGATNIGNSSITDDGVTISTSENITAGTGTTAGGNIISGNATGDTAASFHEVNSGDGASNTEPGYLKLWSSHATKRKASLFPCTDADGILCIAIGTPAADSTNKIIVNISNGTSALGTSAISANACATVVTTAATGVVSTDTITWNPNADISGVTGYGAAATDGLNIYPYPTANNVNWRVCNRTNLSITPGAVTLNWKVTR